MKMKQLRVKKKMRPEDLIEWLDDKPDEVITRKQMKIIMLHIADMVTKESEKTSAISSSYGRMALDVANGLYRR